MSYSVALTLPNLRGKLRQEVSQQVDRILEDLRVKILPWTEVYQIFNTVKNALHNKRTERAAAEKLMRILHEEYHAGHLDTVDEELCLDRYNLHRRFNTLHHDAIVLRTSGPEIEKEIDYKLLRESHKGRSNLLAFVINEAYIDSLIAPYKTPHGATIALFARKDDVAEEKFRDNVLKAYEAKRGKLAWCVVSGQWYRAKDIKIFDIVPHSMGKPTAKNVFGATDNPDGHLMGTKNGLPMHQIYAEAFRKGHLILLPQWEPDDDQDSLSRWKVLFWGERGSPKETAKNRRKGRPWGSKLDGRALHFQNQFRPDTRYLFLLYCTSILQRQRYEAPGWWRTCFDDTSSATSENSNIIHLRAPTLRSLAPMRGFLTEEEAAEFAAHNTFPRAPDDSDEGKAFEAIDDETMDAFLADVSNDPGAPRAMSPLSEESHDSNDAIEIDIDGEIEIQGEGSEEWEGVDDEGELGDGWVDVDEDVEEDVDEYAHDDGDGRRDIFKTATDLGLNLLANIWKKKD